MEKPRYRITFSPLGLCGCHPITNGERDLSKDWYYWSAINEKWIKLK